jgi:hypothetical protein
MPRPVPLLSSPRHFPPPSPRQRHVPGAVAPAAIVKGEHDEPCGGELGRIAKVQMRALAAPPVAKQNGGQLVARALRVRAPHRAGHAHAVAKDDHRFVHHARLVAARCSRGAERSGACEQCLLLLVKVHIGHRRRLLPRHPRARASPAREPRPPLNTSSNSSSSSSSSSSSNSLSNDSLGNSSTAAAVPVAGY